MEIYATICNANGKLYIGQTTETKEKRWYRHQNDAKNGSSLPFHRAIRKYGAKNFSVKTVWVADNIDTLNDLEVLFIAAYRTIVPNGYNLDDGGNNRNSHPDTRAKISAAHTGRIRGPQSEDHKAALSAVRVGRIPWNKGLTGCYSEESLQRMRDAHTGVIPSEETRKRISEAGMGRPSGMLGKKHKPETLQRMSDAGRGRPNTPEQNANIGAANRGKRRTPEQRKRIGDAGKGRIPWNKGLKTGPQSPELIERRIAPLRGRKRLLSSGKIGS